MKKKKKLQLNRETMKNLQTDNLNTVKGALAPNSYYTICEECPDWSDVYCGT